MKWSLCSTGNRDKPVEYVLDRATSLGLSGVELWIGHIEEYIAHHGSPDGLIDSLRSRGLAVPAIAPYTYFSKSDEERQTSLAVVEQAAGYARLFGSPLVRVFLGHMPSREATPELWDSAVAALRQALDIADRHGVDLGLEMHNNMFADAVEPIQRIFREAAHPRLRLIFDGFNLYLDRLDQREALEALYPYTAHVHIKSYNWDLDAPETRQPTDVFAGDVDNRAICEALRDKGYDGFLSFEYFGEDGERCVRESVELLRREGWMK